MILDLHRFLRRRRPLWDELDWRLRRLETDPFAEIGLDDIRRVIELYEEAVADLADLRETAAETELRAYVEALVARAYAEIHALRAAPARFRPGRWLAFTLPRALRRHGRHGAIAAGAMLVGALVGAAAIVADPAARRHLLPFEHLRTHPSERVAAEERAMAGGRDRVAEEGQSFAVALLVNNARVSILALALGMTFGAGTVLLLFFNGVLVGAVCADFVLAGETAFLAGWLLPHGSIELPAIVLAGQAGLLLGHAMIGWGDRRPRTARLASVAPDLLTLIGGSAVMLAWAAVVEAFLSQYHEPQVPYALKIGFGMLELAGLGLYIGLAGRGEPAPGAKRS